MAELESFEVAEGETFGDLLSKDRVRSGEKPKIGLLAGGFFEYWRMYPGTLKETIEKDNQVVLQRLSQKHQIIYPGLVDSMDVADEAGRRFCQEQVDLLIITERTYVPDIYIHQVLLHTPSVPLLLFVSQPRDTFNFQSDYEDTLRNSGMMSIVQLSAGFRKMGIYDNFEVVVGSIHDDQAYREIDRYIDVITIYKQLKAMTIGVIGHVFRGMFDFEYDKTMVKGILGPEVLHIQIGHLLDDLWEAISAKDAEVQKLIKKVYSTYQIEGVEEDDIMDAACVAVALKKLVRRFRLDGLVLLGQHYVEAKTKATSYLGMAELHAEGTLGVTEGDVLGLIMMKIMRHFTGLTPFFGEWAEFDVQRNAMMFLGHGYADPTQAKNRAVKITPTPEQWGFEGKGFSFEMTFDPGPVTFGHFISVAKGWRMLISTGEIMDLPTMPIHEVSLLVKIERPIKEYVEILTKHGFAHHCIVVRGDLRKELSQLADLMRMEKIFI